MDKKTLNNEIIICRKSVRKARVAVIRKIVKNIRILKSCKNEVLKEKKLKKAERLFNKIQIMKKLKDDDVTKFALLNKDLEKFVKDTSFDLKENAMACLAKHVAVVKKVESIREQIPNWEMEIPLLLDSLGKKRLNKKNKKEQSVKSVNKIANEVPKRNEQVPKSTKTKSRSTEKEIISKMIKSEENSFEDSESKEIRVDSEEEEPQPPIKKEKIEDPFFIGKKVIPPKPVQETSPKEKVERKKFQWEASNSIFHTKPFKVKKEPKFSEKVKTSAVENEKLHPSWAAKKVQLIKPFEGKKITFSD